jgi:hypothetical protein
LIQQTLSDSMDKLCCTLVYYLREKEVNNIIELLVRNLADVSGTHHARACASRTHFFMDTIHLPRLYRVRRVWPLLFSHVNHAGAIRRASAASIVVICRHYPKSPFDFAIYTIRKQLQSYIIPATKPDHQVRHDTTRHDTTRHDTTRHDQRHDQRHIKRFFCGSSRVR